MKKNLRLYLIAWVVLLALFNVMAFLPVSLMGEKYSDSFWIGYALITVTFVGQLACSYMAFKADSAQKAFYNISLIRISIIGLGVSFVAGGLCMLISPLPYWVGIVVCATVLAVNVIAVLKASAVIDKVVDIDEKVKKQTFFIKSLTVDAETLMMSAKSETVKAECRKVYESVRYSDPMSNDALSSVEEQISIKFTVLSDAVQADDTKKAAEAANAVIILVGDRNRKCKILK